MNFDRTYNQNRFFKNPDIFYTAGDKHFLSYENTLWKYFMVSFIYIDQSRIGLPMTCTLINNFQIKGWG